MKVLWTVNIIPASVSTILALPCGVLGGWVDSMASIIKSFSGIELGILFKCDTDINIQNEVDGIHYFSMPYSSKTSVEELCKVCEDVIQVFHPDLIQIEGTEFLHAKAMIETGEKNNIPVLVSMQGILNGQYSYQCGHLPIADMMFSHSPTNILAAWILHLRKTRWYAPRMIPEKEIIKKTRYIVGRTTWDRAHTYAINPEAKYYSCNRILRPPFYNKRWNIDTIERHSIYVGNGYYALKGLHFVVEAVDILQKHYPDIHVYVAGLPPYQKNDKRSILKRGYGIYLKKLIEGKKLENFFVFTGALQAEQVADRLSKVNAYVLCSVAENSPNTLGEAMIVGTPCIASFVGGVPDMVTDGVEALIYRDDDPEMLAWRIKSIFDNDKLCLSLSKNARERALLTHDPMRNAEDLAEIYRNILSVK